MLTDCTWEISNIGRTTAEITVAVDDVFNAEDVCDALNGYQYVVVKVPMKRVEINECLSKMGFCLIEVQMNVSMSVRNFDVIRIETIYKDIDFEPVDNEISLSRLVTKIVPGMFCTDRISLDSRFGLTISANRYRNWINTEYSNGDARITVVRYQGEEVGFMMFKIMGNTFKLLLNGLYKPFQGRGLGIITPASPFMYISKYTLGLDKVITSISSNNIPIVKLYNRLGFTLDSQYYVFVNNDCIQ